MKLCLSLIALLLINLSSPQLGAQPFLDPIQTGNNTGSVGLPWRWNEAASANPTLDDASGLVFTIHAPWDQYLDTPIPSLLGKAPALMIFFAKSAAGDVAIGFVPNPGWGEGKDAPQSLRLLKVKGTSLHVSRGYFKLTEADEDTGAKIIPDKLQGLMMKISPQGELKYFYQDGEDRDINSPSWREIAPASDSNRSGFDFGQTMIGVNSSGAGGGVIKIRYVALYDTKAGDNILLNDDFKGRAPDKYTKMREERGNHPEADYYDKSLPRDIPVKPFEGERYETEIPDTEELSDYANRALIAMTGLVSPKEEYVTPQLLYVAHNPPIMELRDGALINTGGKWAEALPLMRVMCGNNENLEIDGKIMATLVRYTGIDGLCYQPIEGRRWAFFDPVNKAIGKPFSDIFGEGRQLRMFATWYQHDRNPLWKQMAQKKAHRMLELSVKDGDTRYLRSGRGYSPWYKETGSGEMIAVGDVGHVSHEMTGIAAAHMVSAVPQAAVTWRSMGGDSEIWELGEGLARYLFQHGKILGDGPGQSLEGMAGYLSHAMMYLIPYALEVGDRNILKTVNYAFKPLWDAEDLGNTGIVNTPTLCTFDMVHIGMLLSQAGCENYWDAVDRRIRNNVLPCQILPEDIEPLKKQEFVGLKHPDFQWKELIPMAFEKRSPSFTEGLWEVEGGLDMSVGAMLILPFGVGATTGDCTANTWRLLHGIWDSVLDNTDSTLKINLHFNRASPWADVDSYIPYEGKVVVKMKVPKQEVLIRIPQWTDWNQVKCSVNNKDRSFAWSKLWNGYIQLNDVGAKDVITVEFPMKQWTEEGVYGTDKKPYKVVMKGNTVIEATGLEGYRVKQHEKFHADRAPMRKIARFVSNEHLMSFFPKDSNGNIKPIPAN